MKTTILAVLMLAGLAQAQTHNVVLTWHVPSTEPAGTTYNAYKASGICPTASTAPSANPIPFAQISTGITVPNYTDANSISVGQSFCYYVTAVNGSILNATGVAVPNESGPSNYAQASIVPAGTPPPPAPTVLSVTVQ